MMLPPSWTLQEVPWVMEVLDSVFTLLAFLLACCLMLLLGVSYLVTNFIRDTWVNFLEKRFPDLEFVRRTSVRSAVDTHRNMGIIALLVTVKGRCDPLMVKRRLIEDVLEKRHNNGRYAYRHLRKSLTTRWGRYAWQDIVPFNIDNHLLISSAFYRGRPITDLNIQEFVSETVSKYLVPEHPPWHITVIPGSTEKYYMLIRIHHLLLSHQDLDLGDLLLLSYDKAEAGSSKHQLESPWYKKSGRTHPFQGLYKPPRAIPLLWDHLAETFSNNWNEFLSVYDPLENPSVLKNPSLKSVFAIFIITAISIMKNFSQQWTLSRSAIKRELRQRQLTMRTVWAAVWNTLNPLSVVVACVKASFHLTILLTIKLPLLVICELRSICMIYDEQYLDSSLTKSLITGWVIIKDAVKEAVYYGKLMYNGPKIILEELFFGETNTSHPLQAMSICGRKVVSWSDPIPLEMIQQVEQATGATACEILLSATALSLRDYLMHFSLDIPDHILTTARYFPQEQLMQSAERGGCPPRGGVLCLALPTRNPFGLEEDPVSQLRGVQQTVLKARLRQPALYLASLWQLEYGLITQVLPSPLVRLLLNVLSRRFAITLSEVTPADPYDRRRRYLWGQEVEDLMYWRPPQANICMSLTLMTFGDSVRLGVMTDALLSPQHNVISLAFSQHVADLALTAGVTSNMRSSLSFMTDDSDSPGVSQSSQNSTMSSSSLDFDFDSRNYSDDDNNVNHYECYDKFTTNNKLQFNIPS